MFFGHGLVEDVKWNSVHNETEYFSTNACADVIPD